MNDKNKKRPVIDPCTTREDAKDVTDVNRMKLIKKPKSKN